MSWKRYTNEIIVLSALLVLLLAFSYRHDQAESQSAQGKETQLSLSEIKEVVSLKRVWADKTTGKKAERLKTVAESAKVKWTKKGKSVTAVYEGLTSQELNALMNKLLNLAVEIKELDISKQDKVYKVTLQCKW